MPKMQTPADLDRRREEVAPQLLIRLAAPTTIRVGMGACGIAAGARASMHAILAELSQRQLTAHVTVMDCIGACAKEPIVQIEQTGQPVVIYGNVRPDRVSRLIEEHLVKGQPVTEWILG